MQHWIAVILPRLKIFSFSPTADELPPDEISVSLCKLGGHMDLMPVWFHFLSREAIYLVAFDLEQDLMNQVSRQEWDSIHKEWVEVKDGYTNLDVLIGWINTIHHKTRCSKKLLKTELQKKSECIQLVCFLESSLFSYPD